MDMNQGQSPQQIQIDPSQTEGIKCTAPNCNSEFFMPMFMLRKISALLSPSGREEIIQVPVMVCSNCGKPFAQDEQPPVAEPANEGTGEGIGKIVTP